MTIRMRAISQDAYGGPQVLKVVEVDRPTPGPGEVLVRVRAAGVNPADWKIRSGQVTRFGEPPFTLGLDVCGVVEAVGEQVTRFRPGDEVYGVTLPPRGAYAEYAVAPVGTLAAKPPSLDSVHAAALPVAALTAWQALVRTADVRAGQRVLVHAAVEAVSATWPCRSPRRAAPTSSARPGPATTRSCASWARTSSSTTPPSTSPPR